MCDFDVNGCGELAEAKRRIGVLEEHLASSRAVAARALEDVRRLDAVACAAHRDRDPSDELRAAMRTLLNRGYILQGADDEERAAFRADARAAWPWGDYPTSDEAREVLEGESLGPAPSDTANRMRAAMILARELMGPQAASVGAILAAVAVEIDALRKEAAHA